MNPAVFITGTDTDVGKTVITSALLRQLTAANRTAIGMKPVACGAEPSRFGLRNLDALKLLAHSNPKLAYSTINPCVYKDPTSPNIAAARGGEEIEFAKIERAFKQCRRSADVVLVEGIGGWRVPLSGTLQIVDLVRFLKLPVILVCGLRVGCINHTILSASAILDDGLELLGWIANTIDPTYAYARESIETLRCRIDVPLLGVSPWHEAIDIDVIANALAPGTKQLWK